VLTSFNLPVSSVEQSRNSVHGELFGAPVPHLWTNGKLMIHFWQHRSFSSFQVFLSIPLAVDIAAVEKGAMLCHLFATVT